VGILDTIKRKRGKQMMFLLILIFLGLVYFYFWNGEQLNNLSVNTTNITLVKTEKYQPFVILRDRDGSRVNVTEHSQYATSNEKIAIVNSSGVITSINPGSASITINYRGMTQKITVSVKDRPLLVNVKDYGAKGDGLINDTTPFQDAIDDLYQEGGGDVFVPNGTYIVNSIFLKPNVNLIGESRDRVIVKLADDAPDGYRRVINMNHDTKIQNITCDGNFQKHVNGVEHMHCIFAYDKKNILIDNNRLKNAVGDGISVSGSLKTSKYVTISNNIVEENQRSQIVIEQVNHLRIYNNTISSVTGRPGIHFEPWEKMQYYDTKIKGNTITTNTDGYAVLLTGAEFDNSGKAGRGYLFHGIEFYQNKLNSPLGLLRIIDTSGAKVHDNILNVRNVHVWRKNENVNIYGNTITGDVGIDIEGGWKGKLKSSGTRVYDNFFTTTNEGLIIHEGAEKISIDNNSFIGESNHSGIKLLASEDIKDITVSDNTFNNYANGVVFDYYSHADKLIAGVTIQENSFIDLQEFAVSMKGSIQNVSIVRNVVSNSSGAYINAHEGRPMSTIEIIHNIISGGKKGIIYDEYGNGELKKLRIIGNQVSDTKENAIEINPYSFPPKNVSIEENVLINNARNLITVPDSIQSALQNNVYKKRDKRR
jgi:hypothetical protein